MFYDGCVVDTNVPQVRFVPRTAAGSEFRTLLASADVILHPFPFGGSKTAADGLSMGIPVVAMLGDGLPGRMAYSLYKTMGLDGTGNRGCCVAIDRERYASKRNTDICRGFDIAHVFLDGIKNARWI